MTELQLLLYIKKRKEKEPDKKIVYCFNIKLQIF